MLIPLPYCRMVSDAEKYAAEDEEIKERTAAKNGFEGVVYGIKSQIGAGGDLADKIDAGDKEKLQAAVDEAITFLESNSEAASIDEIKEHQQQFEAVSNPIMQKLYSQGGAPGGAPGGMPGGAPGGGDSAGPEVEEVD